MKTTKILIILAASLALCPTGALAVIFTSNTTISAGNTTYEGQEIVINGCTVTVNGTHAFDRLTVTNAGTLTHSPAGGQPENHLQLTIAHDVIVTAGSSIDGTGLGFGNSSGPGAPPSPVDTEGGAYGGLGGRGAGRESGVTYGSILQPVDWGSGGAGSGGGGAVQLTIAGAFTLNGNLRVNGTTSGGGGSGGSIYLTVGTLNGSGQISANGGVGNGNAGIGHPGGGGGGGRVAIYYDTNNFAGTVTAVGGSAWDTPGGAGTVYWQHKSDTVGQLVVDNGAQPNGAHTPLTSPAAFELIITNGARTYAQSTLVVNRLVMATNSSLIQLGGQSNLTITVVNDAIIDAGGIISADGAGYGDVTGPGAPVSGIDAQGGAYGGMGGGGQGRESGFPYGSVVHPTDLGSGGVHSAGGGALRLSIGGIMTLEGKVTANGTTNLGGGSGGSIYLTVGTLNGAGRIAANGGQGLGNVSIGHPGGGGGGGRVAIYYGTNNFSGNVTALGGDAWDTPGGAGTILRKRAADAFAQVLIDNGGLMGVTRLHNGLWPPTEPFLLDLTNSVLVIPMTPLLLAGLNLTAGAHMTHDAVFDFNLTILGDAAIAGGCAINVNGKGYPSDKGPGAPKAVGTPPYEENSGASHGGVGGANGGLPGSIYDQFDGPTELGSGADAAAGTISTGGGAVRLSVGGSLLIDGSITANGTTGGGGASGGSVYLTVGTFSGGGIISANGGDSIGNLPIAHIGGGGGGGRIAIYAQNYGFVGQTQVAGGAGSPAYAGTPGQPGNPGTIFQATNSYPLLNIVRQIPSGPLHGAVSSVAVIFNTAANPSSLTADDIVIQTPSGPIPQNLISVGSLGGTLFQINFPAQTAAGTYTVQVGPNIGGLFGQGMDQNGNGTPGDAGDAYSGSFSILQPIIFGSIHSTNGTPIAGLTVRASDGSAIAVSGADGAYALGVAPGWSGNVIPDSAGWVWTPSSRAYVNLAGDTSNQDFAGTLAEPLALTTARSASSLHFSWPSALDLHYQFQSTTNLAVALWVDEGAPFMGTGGALSTNFTIGAEPQKFFRLQLLDH